MATQLVRFFTSSLLDYFELVVYHQHNYYRADLSQRHGTFENSALPFTLRAFDIFFCGPFCQIAMSTEILARQKQQC